MCWDQSPTSRIPFSDVYQALEDIKKNVAPFNSQPQNRKLNRGQTGPNLRVSNSPTAPAHSGPGGGAKGVEDSVTKAFAGRDSITWSAFATAFGSALNATADQVRQLEYLFNEKGVVKKAVWDQFLQWFTPLVAPDMYQTSTAAEGWAIDSILEITTPPWFHGFVESTNAQKALKSKSDGAFLFRFSTTNPGCYALSVAYSNTVGHWRISCDKLAGKAAVFKIDGREYRSLKDVVQTHAFGKEPLKIKQPKPNQASTCFLGAPLSRTGAEGGELYQNV